MAEETKKDALEEKTAIAEDKADKTKAEKTPPSDNSESKVEESKESKSQADSKEAKDSKAVRESKGTKGDGTQEEASSDKTQKPGKSDKASVSKTAAKEDNAAEEKPKKPKKEAKEDKVDIVSENIYTVPFGKIYTTKPHYRRARKAVKFLHDYLVRHTKTENVSIDNGLNQHIWSRGSSKPPRRVQIKAVKDSEGKVIATLLK